MGHKKITASNETALRAKSGDAAAITELWDECFYLVKSICAKYMPEPFRGNRLCDWNDLLQSSYIAFRRCLEKWEPRENVQFSTYLTYYVREACRLEVGSIVRKGVKMDLLPFTSSYDIPVGDGNNSDKFLELIVDESAGRDFERVEISLMQQLVRGEVNALPEMERRTINLHHFEGKFIPQIAEILGVCKNTVVNCERRAFAKLRRSIILRSLYTDFVGADLESCDKPDAICFRLKMLEQLEYMSILRSLFDDDALEIFL